MIGCVAQKQPPGWRGPAADLYRGQLWNARRKYAEDQTAPAEGIDRKGTKSLTCPYAAGWGPGSWPAGLEILASCHSATEAAELQAEGWRTARLVADRSEGLQRGEAYCPYDLAKSEGTPMEERPTCASCRLCLPGDRRPKPNIVFIEL